jgi:hydroxypyruvate isomerase
VIWSAHLSTLFQEWPALERPAAAAAAGFTHAESWWPGEHVAEWAGAVSASGLQLACVNAYGGDLAAGERGFLNVPARRVEAVAAVAAAIELAESLGGRAVNVLVGRRTPDTPPPQQLADARSVLHECVSAAKSAAVTLVIEHLNETDVPGALLPTPRAAAAFVEDVGSDAVRLLYDAYHAAQAGLDPVTDVRHYGELIGHAQYADAPGRGEPGTGTVDLFAFAAALGEAGYAGPVGLEFVPRDTTAAALTALDLAQR